MNPCANLLLALLPHQEKGSFSVFNNIQSLKIHSSLKVTTFSNVDRLHRNAASQVMWSHIRVQPKQVISHCTFQLSCLSFILCDIYIMRMHFGDRGTDLELGELENYNMCVLCLYSEKKKLF